MPKGIAKSFQLSTDRETLYDDKSVKQFSELTGAA